MNFHMKFFQVLFTTTRFSNVLSCEDLLISSCVFFFFFFFYSWMVFFAISWNVISLKVATTCLD